MGKPQVFIVALYRPGDALESPAAELRVTARDWYDASNAARRMLAWRDGRKYWEYRELGVRVRDADTGQVIQEMAR